MIIEDVFLQSSDIVLLQPLLDRLEANCADSGISLALGRLLALYGEVSPAIAHCKRAIKHFPRCWGLKESLFLALESSYQLDQESEVLGSYGEVENWCEDAWIYQRKVSSFHEAGFIEKAIQTCALGLGFYPLYIQLYQTLADLYLEKGASQPAIDLLQAAKAHPCLGFSASKILIRVYESLGRDEEATNEAIGLTVTHPDRWDTYSELWGTLTSTSNDNKTTNILLKLTTRQYPR
jgi:tetratricopeptide (TPR) repeat protein